MTINIECTDDNGIVTNELNESNFRFSVNETYEGVYSEINISKLQDINNGKRFSVTIQPFHDNFTNGYWYKCDSDRKVYLNADSVKDSSGNGNIELSYMFDNHLTTRSYGICGIK